MAHKTLSKSKSQIVSPARIAVFEILLKIETEKAFSSILLPLYEEDLSEKDSALCHELTLGVLRKQIYLDKIIESFTNGKKLDLEVIIALRIGLYQILFLDKIPVYSAINESVNLVQKAKKTSAKGLVNAVLRRATREKVEFKYADQIEKISVETSHPRWLIEKWIDQFEIETAEQLAKANNEIPQISFRFTAKSTDAIKNLINEKDFENDKTFLRELAANGKIYFQDEGSQLVAQLVELKEDQNFLDVCAAPGSKVTQVASVAAKLDEKEIAAGDFHFHRLKFLRESAKKQGLKKINFIQYDAEKSLPFAENSFDWVLVDAPCSGTGTIRHNPEIRYVLQKEDFDGLSSKQLKILNNASKLTKSGGKLIYSTCSLEIEENEMICKRFLAENSDFDLIEPNVPKKFLTDQGFARTFPQKDKMDGFFIAVFKKL